MPHNNRMRTATLRRTGKLKIEWAGIRIHEPHSLFPPSMIKRRPMGFCTREPEVKSRIRIGRDWHASMRRALTNVWAIIIRLSSSYICMYVFHLRRSHLRILLLYIHMLRWRYRHRLTACSSCWAPLLCAVCPFCVSSLFQRLFNPRRNDLEGQGGTLIANPPLRCGENRKALITSTIPIIWLVKPVKWTDRWLAGKTRKSWLTSSYN